MPFIMINEPFVCADCGAAVSAHPNGSARNHCPECLCSLHADAEFPGDRKADCLGLMDAVSITQSSKKGLVITHRCRKCGKETNNKCAEDDDTLPFIRSQAQKQWTTL